MIRIYCTGNGDPESRQLFPRFCNIPSPLASATRGCPPLLVVARIMNASPFRVMYLQRGMRIHRRSLAFVTSTAAKTCRQPVLRGTSASPVILPIVGRQYTSTASILKDYPPHTLYPMPALSPTMEVGTIANWNKLEGDSFSAGDSLCAIETDKASVDFEAQDDGIIAKILREGVTAQDIAVGTPICVVVEEADDVAAFADFVVETDEPKPPAAATTIQPTPASSPPPPVDRDVAADFVLMPSARHLSQSKGVDATGLQGTGKGGRVTKGDVLQALANGTTMPPLSIQRAAASTAAPSIAPPPVAVPLAAPVAVTIPVVDTHGAFEDIANNKMRKIIASRLTESKSTVPHFYTSMEVELDGVMKLRKNLAKHHDIKISVNDLIIRSSALALRDVPEVNASFNPKTKEVALQNTIDISVAVATPTGLITPIVPGSDKMGLAEITATVKDLAGRARDGKLQPHEYQGGTFCISNLGMFGINEFSAVINPPQAAILAVGGGTKRIVPTAYVEGAEEQSKPEIKTVMTARLSADRRVVDEATAALFLQVFRHYMTKPELLLL